MSNNRIERQYTICSTGRQEKKLLQGSCNSNYATIINTGVRVKKKGNVHALTKKEKRQLLILRQKHSYRGRTKAARSALCTETVHKL